MICPNCKNAIPDDAEFCGNCGYKLAGETKKIPSKPHQVSEEMLETIKNRGRNQWLFIVGAIAGLAVVAFILVNFIFPFKDPSTTMDEAAITGEEFLLEEDYDSEGAFSIGEDDMSPEDPNVLIPEKEDGTPEQPETLIQEDAVVEEKKCQMVFSGKIGDTTRVFTINEDGSNLKQLTDSDVNSTSPAWSSDGRYIAFISDRGSEDGSYKSKLYVMDKDGSGQVSLYDNDSMNNVRDPAWSPIGNQIAFLAYDSSVTPNYFLDDFDLIQLTDNTDPVPMGNIIWSPDGNQFVFWSEQNGDEEIFVMNADGSNLQKLTNNDLADDWNPVWSPDGNRIAFISDRSGNDNIYVMDADGGNQQKLTKYNDYRPAWSPDGKTIAFTSRFEGNYDIFLIDADGNNMRQITENSFYDRAPVWSPNGEMIVFISNRDGEDNLYIMMKDGGEQRKFADDEIENYASIPEWSPNCK